MDISLIDIDKVIDDNYKNIIELLIEAVNDYPILNLSDLDVYIEEVKNQIRSEVVTIEAINKYLYTKSNTNEEQIWINESLASLREALKLIEFRNITFLDVSEEVKRVSK
jgi:hypothetical protein